MAPYESDDGTTAGEAEKVRAGRRKASRYAVPVAVVGVAAATIGIVPALADSGDPDLPEISARQLLEKVAASDVEQMSGTVKINTDLGLPDLGGLAGGLASGLGGAGGGHDSGSAADPSSRLMELATGTHTLRVAADGPDRQKVSLLENAAEYSVIHNGKDVWGYDSASDEVYHSTADGTARDHRKDRRSGEDFPATPGDFADEALKAADGTTSVTVDGTERIAGRDAYKLLIRPRQSGTTVGAVSIAVDAKTGTPLKFTLTPASGGAAVLDVGFTKVSFAAPAASTFDFTPPKGAEVTEGDDRGGHPDRTGRMPGKDLAGKYDGLRTIGEGWNTVAVLDTGGSGMPSGSAADGGLGGFLGSLGDHASGKFGSGTVFSTRLVNALITDDGKVYVGTVDKATLVRAADAAK
ncbi:LolA family protein [Streptomyces sp. MS06]|uniref:LolA family protein n=1 Tax=Streptomyces sp. MS06 TaxID=3385974 RepID=UPI0039A3B0E3